jgi:hypothetical protein
MPPDDKSEICAQNFPQVTGCSGPSQSPMLEADSPQDPCASALDPAWAVRSKISTTPSNLKKVKISVDFLSLRIARGNEEGRAPKHTRIPRLLFATLSLPGATSGLGELVRTMDGSDLPHLNAKGRLQENPSREHVPISPELERSLAQLDDVQRAATTAPEGTSAFYPLSQAEVL